MTGGLSQALEAAWASRRSLSFYDFQGASSRYTFTEFGEKVRSIVMKLKDLGLEHGHVVALMGATGPELVSHCAAVWQLGATLTVLPTPTRLGNLELFISESIEKIVRSKTSLLIGDEAMVTAFAELVDRPCLSWDELRHTRSLSLEPAGLEVDGVALIQFSSGTTRRPQPILLGSQALLQNSRAVLEKFPGGAENHSLVSWLPLYHDMGLIGCFLMPLLAPGDLTLMGPEVFAVRPSTWLRAISSERATTSSAPNFALSYCTDRISEQELEELDLSSWRIAMVGAETVRPNTLRKFAERFGRVGFDSNAFSPVYGLAEATLAVTFSPLGAGFRTFSHDPESLASQGVVREGRTESTSLGRPLAGVEVEIRKEGQVLPEDRLGDVWVKSPSLLSGYLVEGGVFDPLKDGWLETGDAGYLHEGELYLYGRRRDILLLDGRNHDPALVEEAAEALPELRKCCAVCLENADGEKDSLLVLCEVSKSWSGDAESLKELIRVQVGKASGLLPGLVELVEAGELPLTSSGKLRRAEAARMYRSKELALA